MRADMRKFMLLASLASFGLAGCGTSDILGGGKDAPDEFAIVTKQPLIIPPEFNLHPPRPGSAPTNQLSPTDAAQAALFSDDPNQVAGTIKGDFSPGEKMLLATAGAAGANDSIRQLIAADNKKLEAANDDFTNNLLFGGGSGDSGTPLDADAEKARLDATKPQARPVAQAPITRAPADDASSALPDDSGGGSMPDVSGAAPADVSPAASAQPGYDSADQSQMAGTLPDVNGAPSTQPVRRQPAPKAKKKKDDSGWFDGIF